MDIMVIEKDLQEISQNYPALNYSLSRRIIWGTLEFACSYDYKMKEIVYDDFFDNYIRDSYEIRIDFNQNDSFGFPKLFEESEIIKNFALKENIRLEALHVNKDDCDSCCLGIFPEYKWVGAA